MVQYKTSLLFEIYAVVDEIDCVRNSIKNLITEFYIGTNGFVCNWIDREEQAEASRELHGFYTKLTKLQRRRRRLLELLRTEKGR